MTVLGEIGIARAIIKAAEINAQNGKIVVYCPHCGKQVK
jgi:uncharacterized C2H2 Zn-finger protein